MNTKRIISVWSTGISGVVILAGLAVLLPAGALAHHCKGAHASDAGCNGGGGGGGSSEIPVSTIFSCPTGPSRDCPDADNRSLFQADAPGAPYEHDVDNVRNVFNDTGGFVLTMHKRQNKIGTRKVWWEFPMGVDFESVMDVTGTDDLDSRDIDHKTVIQVGKFTDVDLRALAPDLGLNDGTNVANDVDMLLDLNLATSKNSNDVLFVRYSPTANGQCPGSGVTSGVTVTRTDDGSAGQPRTWTIEPGALACMYNSVQDYGDFDFGPLVLTVTEQL